jgi:hypothetical protein
VGHDQVRDYWLRQWAEIDSSVHQVGRDREGKVLFDDEVRHVYAFHGDLVERMTIEQ